MTINAVKKNSEELLSKLSSLSEQDLAELVIVHNHLYFVENAPEISDEAFDKLVEALRFINPQAAVLSLIGSGPKSQRAVFGQDVHHVRPMLSLDKCYDDQEFSRWFEKIHGDFVAMPKIDGVASSLLYSKAGKLIQAATRGDGRVGEDITKNVSQISLVPRMLDTAMLKDMLIEEFLEIRGEMYMPLSRFQEHYAEAFANPRNLAAGALKNKESEKSKSYGLQFLPYDLRGTKAETELQKFLFLERLGFAAMPVRHVADIKEAREVFRDFHDARLSLDYETDGVVFRANQKKDQNRLGETAHHPRYAIAYKFQTESAQTELLQVEWSVSRTGAITPVALVKPVFLSGATISRASLHNFGIFSALGIREKSLVELNRRGGVIPHVERVLSSHGELLSAPNACPSCGSPVITEGDFLLCSGKEKCTEVVVSGLIHFVQVMGLEGFGEKLIRRLYEHGLVRSFTDIFKITASDLKSIDRMGDVLANKLRAQIEKKREIDLATFIRSLGIQEIGTNVSEIVASNFATLPRIRTLSVDELKATHGIGESIAQALVNGMKEHSHEIDELLKEIVVKDYNVTTTASSEGNALYGKSVVFTGKMAHLDRKSAQELVKKLGGTTPGSISAKTDFLIIGDDGSSLLGQGAKSTKQKDAEKLINEGSSLKIISESEFLRLANNETP